jgi:ABC-type Na+ efflux pump permease subunit
MNGTRIIICKEWRVFTGSDRGLFLIYAVLIFSWSFMLAAPASGSIDTGPLWLVFFSVVISANFSNTVFISERVNGILEILLTSGVSRKQILYGKMLFVGGMSTIIGLLCIALSVVWRSNIYHAPGTSIDAMAIVLYCSAVFMNTACSAWLSVLMSNPRLLHLANLLTLALLVTLHSVVSIYIPVPPFALDAALLLIGSAATISARRMYESEKILQPVNL